MGVKRASVLVTLLPSPLAWEASSGESSNLRREFVRLIASADDGVDLPSALEILCVAVCGAVLACGAVRSPF